jgi:hypothetical protein
MMTMKIILGCIIGLVLAGLVLWLAIRASRHRDPDVSQEGIYAWFRRRH